MSNRKKNKNVAVILCLFGLIGVGGLHRFYLGKNKTGLLYLFTFGVFWIGTIVDLFRLLKGGFAREFCNAEYRLGGSYVLNTHNMVVHRYNCCKVNQITSENYSTTNNLSSALNAGYTACGICKPR